MKRELNPRKDERLCDWCDRIAAYYSKREMDAETFRDILGEVSKWSYIHGSRDTMETILKTKSK